MISLTQKCYEKKTGENINSYKSQIFFILNIHKKNLAYNFKKMFNIDKIF